MSELIGRTMQILELLSESETDLPLRSMSERTGLAKSTVQRILRSLVDAQMASQDPVTRHYSLGPRTLALGVAYQRRIDVRRLSLDALARLRDRFGASACLSIRAGDELLHLDQAEVVSDVRVGFQIGRLMPLWAGAPSRLILASLGDTEVERIVDLLPGRDILPDHALSRQEILDSVQQIRRDHFAVAIDEVTIGASTVSVPVVDARETVAATVSVTGPSQRFTAQHLSSMLPAMFDEAREISRQLGAPNYPRPAVGPT